MATTAKIEGTRLVITVDMEPTPVRSASGKTLVVASTRGNQSLPGVTVQGKPITVGVNAYIRA